MRIPQITFTRFIAAIAIVIFHYGKNIFPFNNLTISKFIGISNTGVSYFFLLSGFILAIVYFNREKTKKGSFYLARFARIYPVYLIALFGYLFFVLYFGITEFAIVPTILTLLLFQAWTPEHATALNSPGWSLSIEAFFYLCFPFIILIFKKLSLIQIAITCFVLWAISLGIHIYLVETYGVSDKLWHHFIYYNPLMHLSTFIFGVGGGIIFLSLNKEKLKRFTLPIMLSTLFIFCVLVLSAPNFLHYHHNGMFAPLFLLFLIALSADKSIVAKTLAFKPLEVLGEISYGIYILQIPVHSFTYKIMAHFNLPVGSTIKFYLYLFILITTSYLSFYLFETPIRKKIRKLLTPKVTPINN